MTDPVREWWYKRHHKKYLKELDKVLEQANVPKKDVVVGGSGVMGAEGLRKIDDLDIAPTPQAFRKLVKAHGVEAKVVRKGTPDETPIAKIKTPKVLIELAPLPWTTKGKDLFGKAKTEYHGYPHWDLEQVRSYKEILGREKDQRDLKLIDKHLAKHSSFHQGFQAELEKLSYTVEQARRHSRLAKEQAMHWYPRLIISLDPRTRGAAMPHSLAGLARSESEHLKRTGKPVRAALMHLISGLSKVPSTPEGRIFKPGVFVRSPESLAKDRIYKELLPGRGLKPEEKELLHGMVSAHELDELRWSKKPMRYPAFSLKYSHHDPDIVLQDYARAATVPEGMRPAGWPMSGGPERTLLNKVMDWRMPYGYRPTRHARKHLARLMGEEVEREAAERAMK
jgi:hypothetical protein